jgi:hypothetical protein
VTTAIVVVQTIFGLLGFSVAGMEVKAIIKGSTMKHALGATWSIFIHGEVPGQTRPALIWITANQHARTPADQAFLAVPSWARSYVPAGTNERQRFPSTDGQRGSSRGIRPLFAVLKQQTLGARATACSAGTRIR